jgi:hypothetical protein
VSASLIQRLALEVDERPFVNLPAPRRAMWKRVAEALQTDIARTERAERDLDDLRAKLATVTQERDAAREEARRMTAIAALPTVPVVDMAQVDEERARSAKARAERQEERERRLELRRRMLELADEWLEAGSCSHTFGRRGRPKACAVCLMLRTHARELRNRVYDRPIGVSRNGRGR